MIQLLCPKLRVFRRPGPDSDIVPLPPDNILSKLGYDLNKHTATLCCRDCGYFVSDKNPVHHVRTKHKARWGTMKGSAVADEVSKWGNSPLVCNAALDALRLATNDDIAVLPPHGEACLAAVRELRARAPDAPLPEGIEGCTIHEGLRCRDCARVDDIDCNDIYKDAKTLLVHQKAKHAHLPDFRPSEPCFYQEPCAHLNVPSPKLYRAEVSLPAQYHSDCLCLDPHTYTGGQAQVPR